MELPGGLTTNHFTKPVKESKEEIDLKNKMYKTELCSNFSSQGFCKYGVKCQFAHSISELRDAERHPKYKTEKCKNFLKEGTCRYGRRCCFKHISEETGKEVEDPLIQEFMNLEKLEPLPDPLENAMISEKITLNTCTDEEESTSSGGNIWDDSPIFLVQLRHIKYYEMSKHFKAPGEPCLPFYK
ncbi:ccch-type zn-finger [Tubulinosema ratisbonensis]|uniref:Ccch-type zn-finger n=1 Tax=Tubulinosema ratisbonensis TaxID=291195 RepID=A0A437AM64_9MICR|nr:ccch-type zn-finger [Tubulinosema ratisbonensis]